MHVLIGKELAFSEIGGICNSRDLKIQQLLQFDGTRALLRDGDDQEWWLTQPDMLCLGFVHAGSEHDVAERLAAWWHKASGLPLATCRIAADEPQEARRRAIAEWLTQRLIGFVAVLGEEGKSLLSQNRQLRRSYDSLQTAFSRLEQFVTVNHLQQLILEYESDRITSFWKPQPSGDKLIQLLPVLSSRLSYFELYFQTPLDPGPGAVHLALRLEPAGSLLQEWAVGYGDILNGWNSFSLVGIVGEPNEVVLECAWSDVAGAPALGLSPPHWDTPYALFDTEAEPSPSIGVRIWSGLPGLRGPHLANAAREIGKSPARSAMLPPDELIGATQLKFAASVERDYESVRYLEKPGRLLVHPHADVPTIAMLPSPLPEGISEAAADVTIATAETRDIEYAMAVLGPEVSPEALFTGSGEPCIGFSGWQLVTGQQRQRLVARLDRPAERGMRLYLATRLPPGSPEAGAWGTWGALEIGYGLPQRSAALRVVGVRPDDDAAAIGAAAPAARSQEPGATVALKPGQTRRRRQPPPAPPRERGRDGGEILKAERVQPIGLGETIVFDESRDVLGFLISGWHPPDQGGVWGSGAESRLAFRVPPDLSAGLRMEIELAVAAADAANPVVTEMIVNDSTRSQTVFTERTLQRVEIGLSNLGAAGVVDVVMRCSRPVCPAVDGSGLDQRLLGVRLARLSLTAADSAAEVSRARQGDGEAQRIDGE
jgi:Family of unknown function (DUF6212)